MGYHGVAPILRFGNQERRRVLSLRCASCWVTSLARRVVGLVVQGVGNRCVHASSLGGSLSWCCPRRLECHEVAPILSFWHSGEAASLESSVHQLLGYSVFALSLSLSLFFLQVFFARPFSSSQSSESSFPLVWCDFFVSPLPLKTSAGLMARNYPNSSPTRTRSALTSVAIQAMRRALKVLPPILGGGVNPTARPSFPRCV